jgi:hypothetical protein
MDVTTTAGDTYHISIPIPSGFPGNPLSNERIVKLFRQAVSYGNKPIPKDNAENVVSFVGRLEQVDNVCDLIPLMVSQNQ